MSGQYLYLEEIEKVANEVLPDLKLSEYPNIKYLELDADSCKFMGKCSKASQKLKFLTDLDYIVEVWKVAWDSADHATKKALLYHELLHIDPMRKKDGSIMWGIRDHDVEEFLEVADKYGPWDHSLKTLMESIDHYNKSKK
jgi:hypothetical protein